MTEVAWLIEQIDSWWPTWLAGVDGCEPVWTTDANLAIRFSRRIDAESLASGLIDEETFTVTEHEWMGG
jgi:hypothetical protein